MLKNQNSRISTFKIENWFKLIAATFKWDVLYIVEGLYAWVQYAAPCTISRFDWHALVSFSRMVLRSRTGSKPFYTPTL